MLPLSRVHLADLLLISTVCALAHAPLPLLPWNPRADKQCKGLKKELKKKLKPYVRNSTRQAKAREKVLKLTIASLDGVAKSSMSRAVQQSAFWHFPGKVRSPLPRRRALSWYP